MDIFVRHYNTHVIFEPRSMLGKSWIFWRLKGKNLVKAGDAADHIANMVASGLDIQSKYSGKKYRSLL